MSKLKRQIAESIGLSGLSAVVTTTVQFIQIAILARLLGPEAFGLMAMVQVVILFGGIFGQMGLHEAIVARKDVSRAEISSLYWFGIAWGVFTYLLLIISAPLAAYGFDEHELQLLIPVALLSVIVTPFGSVFLAFAQKNLKFGLLAWVEISSSIVGLFVAVASAWVWDQGVWALIWGHLSKTVAGTGVLAMHGWLVGPRPQFHVAATDLRSYLGFGLYRVAAMSVDFLVSRVDQILIGSLLGAQALGYYSMATNIVVLPIQKINPVISRVAFPVFAKIRDDVPLLKRGYMQLLRALTFINAPILVGMAAVAPVAVPVLLGEQWNESILLIQILAFYALLRSVGNASGSLVLGMGRADITLYWNLGLLLVVPPVVYIASLTGSVPHIAWSMVALQLVLYLAWYAIFIRKLLGPCFASFAGSFAVPAGLAVAMGIVVIGLDPFFSGFPAVTRLGIEIFVGAMCYVLVALVFQKSYLEQVLRMVKGQPWDISA